MSKTEHTWDWVRFTGPKRRAAGNSYAGQLLGQREDGKVFFTNVLGWGATEVLAGVPAARTLLDNKLKN